MMSFLFRGLFGIDFALRGAYARWIADIRCHVAGMGVKIKAVRIIFCDCVC